MAILRTRYLRKTDSARRIPLPGGGSYQLRANQALVWLKIGGAKAESPPANADKFPAILDTGCSVGLCMTQQQFDTWKCADDTSFLPVDRPSRVNGMPCSRWSGRVWLYRRDLDGKPEDRLDTSPWRLGLSAGIAVRAAPTVLTSLLGSWLCSPEVNAAHHLPLPLLGLPAFTANKLRLGISGYHGHVVIDSSQEELPL